MLDRGRAVNKVGETLNRTVHPGKCNQFSTLQDSVCVCVHACVVEGRVSMVVIGEVIARNCIEDVSKAEIKEGSVCLTKKNEALFCRWQKPLGY